MKLSIESEREEDGRWLAEVPQLPGVLAYGADRNEAYLAELVDWSAAAPADRALALDPQTSGGLLVAVPPTALEDYLSAVPGSVEIGAVEAPGRHRIVLR